MPHADQTARPDPGPSEVIILVDWPGVEKRYYASANTAADGITGYAMAGRTRTLVYRIDEEATKKLVAVTHTKHESKQHMVAMLHRLIKGLR